MLIPSRAISRLPRSWAPLTARFARGAEAGSKPVLWLTRRAVGRRGVFPPQVRAQVTAIACSLPKQCQVPLSRWSRAELARHVVQDPSLPPISASTVGRWLKAERLRPWRYHAWQHIHDPVAFLQRARPVLEAYGKAQALLRTGTWLVCLDEKTSIQAREGEQPPRPARPGKPMLHEARYYRRGARHLFAGLSVADGQVYGTCRRRKRFVDFQAFVQQHILPEALRRRVHTVVFILDNGTTHAPKQLKVGCASKNEPAKSASTFRCSGYHPMRPGLIRSKFGSVSFSANICSPITFSAPRLLKPLSTSSLPITIRLPNPSTGPIRSRSWNRNSERFYDSLYLG